VLDADGQALAYVYGQAGDTSIGTTLTLDEARSRRATHQIEQRRPEDRRCVQTSRFLGALLGSRVPMHLSLLTGGLGLRGTRKRRRTESNDKAQGEYRNYRFHDRLLRF